MKTIGYRKGGLGFLYGIVLLMGVGMLTAGITVMLHPVPIVSGALLIVISLIILNGYFKTPYEAICLTDNDTVLELPKGVKINVGDITDVSYKRATAKGIQYKWGSVTVSTLGSSYTVGCIADCEEVAKEITRLKYERKK